MVQGPHLGSPPPPLYTKKFLAAPAVIQVLHHLAQTKGAPVKTFVHIDVLECRHRHLFGQTLYLKDFRLYSHPEFHV
jgi:hypothetical protein